MIGDCTFSVCRNTALLKNTTRNGVPIKVLGTSLAYRSFMQLCNSVQLKNHVMH
jgi:hypothetical protein